MQESSTSTNDTILDVDNVQINYETRKGDVEAIQGVSFKVRQGETVGLVGESGCGKSTIAFGIVNFLGPNGKIMEGSIRFQGEELVGRSEEELKRLRGDRISMVFQDPMQALNPSVRLGEQLAEVLTCHKDISHEDAWQKSIDMLKRVNMPDVENVMTRYSHQISGGQQQRVV
ncbi:MAG: ATP-binding cassette domain-containing protein, partial [Desulfobacterales bacterium]